jgi:8-oxo-dGTP diphosphatase
MPSKATTPDPGRAPGGGSVSPRAEVAVGAVVRRGDEILLVRRGRGTAVGQWAIPGGRVEFGERLKAAVAREVWEETGLEVTVGRFLGWAERMGDDPTPYHYVILDFAAEPVDPTVPARPGDDADAVAWVRTKELETYPLVAGLAEFLRRVGV